MQIDDADGVVLTMQHLVVSDSPETEHTSATAFSTLDGRFGPGLCDVFDGFDRYPASFYGCKTFDDLFR